MSRFQSTRFVQIDNKIDVLAPIDAWVAKLKTGKEPLPIEDVVTLFGDAMKYVAQEERIGNPFKAKFLSLFTSTFCAKNRVIRDLLCPAVGYGAKLVTLMEELKKESDYKCILFLTGEKKSRDSFIKLLGFLKGEKFFNFIPLGQGKVLYKNQFGINLADEAKIKEEMGMVLTVVNCDEKQEKLILRDDNEALVARFLSINFVEGQGLGSKELSEDDMKEFQNVLSQLPSKNVLSQPASKLTSILTGIAVVKEYLKEFKKEALNVRDCKWLVDMMVENPSFFSFGVEDYEQAQSTGIGRDNLFSIKRSMKRQAVQDVDRKCSAVGVSTGGQKSAKKARIAVE